MEIPLEETLRAGMAWWSRRVWEKGWVANHDGNLSARLDEARYLCTPTALSKGDVTVESLLVVDAAGARLQGSRKPFSEWSLHRMAYAARPDIRAVLHAHPPTATGFAVAGVDLPPPFMTEPVVSLGAGVPSVPWFAPGDAAIQAPLAEALAGADAVLLRNHGVLTVGADLETCFLRMELVEHLCRIALVAAQLGGARAIPAEDVARLLEKRAEAGLGPSAVAPAVAPLPVSAPTGDAFSVVADALRRVR